MKFCEACGSVLVPKRTKDKRLVLECRCGATYQGDGKNDYIVTHTYNNKDRKTAVINGGSDEKKQGTVAKTCPKCGNDRAHFVELPPMWGDEESVYSYRCTICGHTFKEGGAGLGW